MGLLYVLELSKLLSSPLRYSLTVDLHTDCDVCGACYIHSSAHVRPRIFWDGFFNVQTAITPQEHPPVQPNLFKRKKDKKGCCDTKAQM